MPPTKSEKIVPLHAPSVVPAFEPGVPDDDEIEVNLNGFRPKRLTLAEATAQGIDLSKTPKVILLAGRGRTGKTTCARWMSDRALSSARPPLMADLDPTNASLASYFEGVFRPADTDNPGATLRSFEQFISHALKHGQTALVDLGGGDTTLRRLVDELPDLPEMAQEQGAAIVMLHFVGPQVDDLSPVAALEDRGFCPEATAIIQNEALVDPGMTRDDAFKRLHRHSVFRAAVGRGAVPVWMPRLIVADAIEAKRAHFLAARDGAAGLSPFDRSRLRHWLAAIEARFAGIQTWLP